MTFEERHVVGGEHAGLRADRFLAAVLRRGSRSLANRILRGNARFADGRAARPSSRVREGDVLIIPREEVIPPGTPPADALTVLADFGDVLVLDKPAGLLVHRTAKEVSRTVDAILADRESERTEPVHRLDRDTAGCLVAGRGPEAIAALRTLFAGSEVDKAYAAVVADPTGRWTPGCERVLDTPLGLDPSSSVRLRMGAGDQACATEVRCARRAGDQALLDLRIHGGRQHQIRAHLALFGTPIVGDKLYQAGNEFFLEWIERPGAPDLVKRLPLPWHALAAVRVAFPWKDRRIQVEAPLPPHMAAQFSSVMPTMARNT